ncbi:TetR/AcrR family transcriptional regulator [Nocardia sp. NPDC049526]|uniref:TetR/AcrR family transcriptional regulator n=1 Tax=Nocardia sp. NPDC049526 TaxID=3364316 RepID=UPI0037AABBDF
MSTSKRKAYHHGDLRRALVDAGRALVQEDGVAGLTLRAAATRAGVSAAAPYRHFADKEALLAAVMTQGFGELAQALSAIEVDDPLLRLHAIGHRYLEFVAAEPALSQLMFGGSVADGDVHPELAAVRGSVRDTFAGAIGDAWRAGAIRGPSVDAIMLTMRCVMQGLATFVATGEIPATRVRSLADSVFATIDTGLVPR